MTHGFRFRETLAAEGSAAASHKVDGLATVIPRYFTVSGPRMRPNVASRTSSLAPAVTNRRSSTGTAPKPGTSPLSTTWSRRILPCSATRPGIPTARAWQRSSSGTGGTAIGTTRSSGRPEVSAVSCWAGSEPSECARNCSFLQCTLGRARPAIPAAVNGIETVGSPDPLVDYSRGILGML